MPRTPDVGFEASNIVFVAGRAKLADIGLVTDLDASASFVGTMGYVAPEGPGEPSADIYALGKVLYEMATGKDRSEFPGLPSFDGLDEREQRNLRELNAVILKACARNAAQRYKSAGEMREELTRLQLGESIERQRTLERAVKRLKVALTWAAAVSAVAILASFALRKTALAERERNEAIQAKADIEAKGKAVAHAQQMRAEAALAQIQIQRAEDFFAADDSAHAIALLANVLASNLSNRVAAERILSALTYRNYSLNLPEPLQHANWANFSQFSPGGQRMITVSKKDARVWDTQTGRPLTDPLQHGSAVSSVRFSPDGSRLLTTSDGIVQVWDLLTEKPFPLPLEEIGSAQFSPDGRRVITTSRYHNKPAQVWDSQTGKLLSETIQHEARVTEKLLCEFQVVNSVPCRGRMFGALTSGA